MNNRMSGIAQIKFPANLTGIIEPEIVNVDNALFNKTK
jgi:hypothetical protein